MTPYKPFSETTARRGLLRGLAGAGALWAAERSTSGAQPTSPPRESSALDRRIPRMKITQVDSILTGRESSRRPVGCTPLPPLEQDQNGLIRSREVVHRNGRTIASVVSGGSESVSV